MAKESGRIWIDDANIRYDSSDYGVWSFPHSELLVFGEYTNDNGPYLDDWFLVFVTISYPTWFTASVYADGSDQLRSRLAQILGTPSLHGDLAASTDFASRTIWPKQLEGKPLFSFTEERKPWWKTVLRFGIGTVQIELTDEIAEYKSRTKPSTQSPSASGSRGWVTAVVSLKFY